MQTNELLAIAATCAMFFQAEATASQEAVIAPSELAANPDKYDGKHVRVKGYVIIGSHARNIFDSRRDSKDPRAACLGLLGSKAFAAVLRKRTEVVSGTFRKALCGPKDICLYWCSESGIELDE
jgi:hypothetical protein